MLGTQVHLLPLQEPLLALIYFDQSGWIAFDKNLSLQNAHDESDDDKKPTRPYHECSALFSKPEGGV